MFASATAFASMPIGTDARTFSQRSVSAAPSAVGSSNDQASRSVKSPAAGLTAARTTSSFSS